MGILSSVAKGITKISRKVTSFEVVKNIAPNEVGVYIMSLNGKVMYVGRAIENRQNQTPKGLRKRLQEHWRGAANGKPELFSYRDQLTVSLKVCKTVEDAKQLESRLIRQHDTVENGWNLRYES
ncbi:GIY-YIG nuclease family protein [Gracilibacillus phocaeensis]|uniref:GIY-YIG nuclease family protein n=1 Tax=Gracilibacillus phocaeensis TaxID=2042304 RepID=UPI0010304A01|nr:GIY-YIG nuclease family protein [Gracilibacillus phocaeensis]